MKHVVIGLGNLGFDLAKTIKGKGDDVAVLSHSYGWYYPEYGAMDRVLDENPDVVWCTLGAGSIKEAKEYFQPFVDLHVSLPLDLIRHLPNTTKIILFSTDYAANERHPGDPSMSVRDPKSLYAMSKLWMEQMVRELRPNAHVRIIRVGSLYGGFKPMKCFPGKIMANEPESLPVNFVTPTATYWLADFLVYNFHTLFARRGPIHHVAPRGNIRVCDWGMEILNRPVIAGDADLERPLVSELGCSLGVDYPHWRSVWNDKRNLFKSDLFLPKN